MGCPSVSKGRNPMDAGRSSAIAGLEAARVRLERWRQNRSQGERIPGGAVGDGSDTGGDERGCPDLHSAARCGLITVRCKNDLVRNPPCSSCEQLSTAIIKLQNPGQSQVTGNIDHPNGTQVRHNRTRITDEPLNKHVL